MTNQDAMKVKTFLERMMDRKRRITRMLVAQESAHNLSMAYATMFEQSALECLDLLGEIEWPDESCERGDI